MALEFTTTHACTHTHTYPRLTQSGFAEGLREVVFGCLGLNLYFSQPLQIVG